MFCNSNILELGMETLFLLFLLLNVAVATQDINITRKLAVLSPPNCNPHFHNYVEVLDSTNRANQLMANTKTVPIQDRIAVMILFSSGFSQHSHFRLQYLKCSLTKLVRGLSNTTLDIFVWVPETQLKKSPEWLSNSKLPRVYLMPIPEMTWKVPCGLADDQTWAVRDLFSIDYYLMVRTSCSFRIKHILFYNCDFFPGEVEVNL